MPHYRGTDFPGNLYGARNKLQEYRSTHQRSALRKQLTTNLMLTNVTLIFLYKGLRVVRLRNLITKVSSFHVLYFDIEL